MILLVLILVSIRKKADGKLLPGKWLTLDVLTFKKFVIQIQRYVGSMVGINDIDQTEYSLAFKPAKSNGEGLELSESKDFEKFLNKYEKYFKSKKEIIVIAKMKAMKQKLNKKKKRKQIEEEILESDDSDNSSLNENMSKKKKANSVPKVLGLSSHQKAIGIHLKLTAKLLATWAECIMEGTATIEIAPTYPEFSAQHATKKLRIHQPH
ncbi:unnamed protein product [Rhizophagus irregularis]|nr:unnamed protein product [Rhizophagus irregularis]CAB5372486.1 unnamed protein product [Rhizophagus irregularis]